MTEIKFRAWDNVNKRFARIPAYISDDGNFLVDADPNGIDMSGIRKVIHREQYSFAGMFTGLKDKNGKEIYEGDVIMFLDRDWLDFEKDTKRLPVVFENDAFILKGIKENKYGEFYQYPLYKDFGRDRFEVIGNIYQNPDLLK